MRLKGAFIAVIAFVFIVSPFAQETADNQSSGDVSTIEEYYLSQDIELRLIQDEAYSESEELKQLALRNLEKMADEGRLSDDGAAFTILQTLATETYSKEVKRNNRVVNNFPEIRRQACQLLGKIGGEKAKDILLDVVQKEKEPMVVAEAVYGLGKIGINDNEEVTNVLAFKLHQENLKTTPDNNLAFSTLLAIEKLAKTNNGISNPELVSAIGEIITRGNYIRPVKLKALSVLEEMRKAAATNK
ncbi:HEAT repeat domain-containing protein [Spirochaetia bacterium 38H-sp]|uniref:HEAT repeat domain-containing protein n=1 Tax=Rarispira pelagica TaxID=3141764 RepID=A0ABU9UAS7_9SPIR